MRRVAGGLLGVLALCAIGFVFYCAVLYFDQESSIFFPRPNNPQLRETHRADRIEIASSGETLEGWWVENSAVENTTVILYFGGNAEDVLRTATTSQKLDARKLLFVNYRGYGHSTGEPGQAALYEDAISIYDYAIRKGIPPESIVVMGRSLGSGPASMLAGSRPVRAAILITPFDSLTAVASARYPLVLVRHLLRHPFPSVDWARRAHAPVLILGAERDRVIPVSHAVTLSEAWAGEKQLHVLTRSGHNDIEMHPDYYPLINAFLEEVSMQPSR